MLDKFSAAVVINSGITDLWTALTDPTHMAKWMGDPQMRIEVHTDWKIETPILIRGFHHVKFENSGIVLKYEVGKRLSYSHLSSVSRLPDKPENYSILEFILTPAENHTLTLDIKNFPTDAIRRHLEFYWRATLITIKEHVEKQEDRHCLNI